MRTILFTAFNEAYSKLAEITVWRMGEYAARHGMAFEYFTDFQIPEMPDGIYWTKFVKAEELLHRFDRIIWLDVDQLVTNFSAKIQIPDERVGFHISRDWGNDATEPWHSSVCGFAAHRDSLGLIQKILDRAPAHAGQPFPEQEPTRQVLKAHMDVTMERLVQMSAEEAARTVAMINIHGRRVFNAVPDAVCPGQVPEPWSRGDFAAHITMLPIDKRVALAEEILDAIK